MLNIKSCSNMEHLNKATSFIFQTEQYRAGTQHVLLFLASKDTPARQGGTQAILPVICLALGTLWNHELHSLGFMQTYKCWLQQHNQGTQATWDVTEVPPAFLGSSGYVIVVRPQVSYRAVMITVRWQESQGLASVTMVMILQRDFHRGNILD